MSANPVRRLYDWVLAWADRPGAERVLFLLAFAESSFFPVPPDVLLIPLILGARKKWLRLAVLTTLASVLGGACGYFIGNKLWWGPEGFSGLALFFFRVVPGFTQELFFLMREKYELYNFWIIFSAGFTPIPYKIFTVSAGAFIINFPVFLLASIISRGGRFLIVAGLIRLFGDRVKSLIDRYFNWLALLFTVLLVAGFLLLKGVV